MTKKNQNWLHDLFISEAKPALIAHKRGESAAEPKLQDKIITENGSYTPDDGYDGMGKVDVAVPETPTQEKSVDITENGTIYIAPDEGRLLTEVEVNVDVPIGPDYPIYDGTLIQVAHDGESDTNTDFVFEGEIDPMVINGAVKVKVPKSDLGDAPTHMVVEGWEFTSKNGIKSEGTMPIYDYTPLEAWPAGEDEEGNFLFAGSTPKQLVVEDEVNLKLPKSNFGDAKPDDVRAGKIFTSAEGIEQVGTHKDSGGVDKIQRFIELNGNSAKYLFYYFNGASIDEIMDGIDTSKITNMSSMMASCSNLTTVPLFDTSNVTDMSFMFANSTNLTTVPLFDTKNVTTMNRMFNVCKNLTAVPLFDTKNVTNMEYMVSSCAQLTTVPLFDTKNVTNMSRMFSGCSNLTTVPLFDTRNVTNMSSMFNNCASLTGCWIRNIGTNLQVGSGTSYGHLLTLESLLHLCKECRNTGSLLKLTVGSANLEKLASIYVKPIDITDEMRAEDDLIDEKSPFIQCESTDEGAMTIEDYMSTKNWQLA